MKRINIILSVILAVLVAGLAFGYALAQGAATAGSGGFNLDLAAWMAAPAALSTFFIVPVMGFVRKHVLKLDGLEVVIGDCVLGLASTGALVLFLHLAWTLLGIFAFGVSAGLYAAGGYDAIRRLIRPALPKGVTDSPSSGSGNAQAPSGT